MGKKKRINNNELPEVEIGEVNLAPIMPEVQIGDPLAIEVTDSEPKPEPLKTKGIKVIEPVIVPADKKLSIENSLPQLKPGEVFVVPTDDEGNEIPGTGFKTTERAFNKAYRHRNFKIKKKAQ